MLLFELSTFYLQCHFGATFFTLNLRSFPSIWNPFVISIIFDGLDSTKSVSTFLVSGVCPSILHTSFDTLLFFTHKSSMPLFNTITKPSSFSMSPKLVPDLSITIIKLAEDSGKHKRAAERGLDSLYNIDLQSTLIERHMYIF